MIKSARDQTVYSLETKNQSERNAVKSPQLYANSHTQSIKQNHPNPAKPHNITRCELLLLRQQEFLASNLARNRKGQIFNHRCIICRWGKGTGVTLESSTRAFPRNSWLQRLSTSCSSSVILASTTCAMSCSLYCLLPLGETEARLWGGAGCVQGRWPIFRFK